jgi:hypothetical protein
VTVEQLIDELQKHRKTLPVVLAVDTPEYKRVVGKVKDVRLTQNAALLMVELS